LKFESPLIPATLIKRYKRFLADAVLADGSEITAHCPNTGSMRSCGEPGDTIMLSHNPSPKRKLSYTWEYTKTHKGYIGINTQRPNRIVEEAISRQQIPSLSGYDHIRREVPYGDRSRIDLLLEDKKKGRCWIEIKNVTLIEGDKLLFPDAITSRGLKHIKELQHMLLSGDRCVLFFLINRPDGKSFSPAIHIDEAWSRQLAMAADEGLEIMAYRAKSLVTGVSLGKEVPFVFPD